jgi:hypothetical protein
MTHLERIFWRSYLVMCPLQTLGKPSQLPS